MCLFKLLTVASCFPHKVQLVIPEWILTWFLSDPGVVNTLKS